MPHATVLKPHQVGLPSAQLHFIFFEGSDLATVPKPVLIPYKAFKGIC